MKRISCIILAMFFVFGTFSVAAWAQEKKQEAKKEAVKQETKKEAAAEPTAKEKEEFTKKVDLFRQVVTAGEAKKDPLLLLTAVKLLDDLPFKGVAKAALKQDESQKDVPSYDRVALLNQAKEFAAGDAELLAVITKVQEAPEETEVRHHGHRHHRGHYGHHDYYYRPVHHRHYRCTWLYVCGYGGCDYVCR